jgi:hypothetical protein
MLTELRGAQQLLSGLLVACLSMTDVLWAAHFSAVTRRHHHMENGLMTDIASACRVRCAALLCFTLVTTFLAFGQASPARAEAPDLVTVSFESLNKRGYYVRHSSYLGVISQYSTPQSSVLDRTPLEKLDATFIVSRGLSGTDDSVSFESVNYRGHYLRHQNYEIKLQRNDHSELFRRDASFIWRDNPPLVAGETSVSLESVNFPGHYIRHQNFKLWLAQRRGPDSLFDADATFLPRPGLRPPGIETVSFRSINRPDRYIRHASHQGELTPVSGMLDRADATFMIRPGLTGQPLSVSYESVNYPGHYLRHRNFRVRLDRDDGSALFKSDATFFRRAPLAGGSTRAVSLESSNLSRHYIRHQDYHLWLAPPDAGNQQTFPSDATFEEVEGFVTEPLPCGVRQAGPASAVPPGPVSVPTVLSTVRLGQLTGNTDPEGLPILNHSGQGDWAAAGVDGVDMGASADHKGSLFIFFGDVVGKGAEYSSPRRGADLVAWTSDTQVRPGGFQLTPVTAGLGRLFDPYTVDSGVGLGLARTPTGAFSYKVGDQERMFVFAIVSDPSHPAGLPSTVLASKEDPRQPGPYRHEFKFSHGKYWSVVPIVVSNAEHPGLPSSVGQGLVILAGGEKNAVNLAWMELDPAMGPKLSTVRYYTGTPGNPWSAPSGMTEAAARANPAQAFQRETEAQKLVGLPPYYSSVSAGWLPSAKRWILMYSTGGFETHRPHVQRPELPIVAHFGANPWTWSKPVDVFNPCRDLAFGRFIHWTGLDDIQKRVPPQVPPEPEKDAWALERGHAYGAFILNRYTNYEPWTQNLTLVYLLSAFNPYQVQVMSTLLRLPPQ